MVQPASVGWRAAGIDVTKPTARDVAGATGSFYDATKPDVASIRHLGRPQLQMSGACASDWRCGSTSSCTTVLTCSAAVTCSAASGIWDGEAAEPPRGAAEPRRALIPDYESYEPPRSRWEKVRWVEFEDVQFVAFILMLCLAALFALTVLVAAIANSALLSAIAIVLGVGALFSYFVAYSDELGTGDGGGG